MRAGQSDATTLGIKLIKPVLCIALLMSVLMLFFGVYITAMVSIEGQISFAALGVNISSTNVGSAIALIGLFATIFIFRELMRLVRPIVPAGGAGGRATVLGPGKALGGRGGNGGSFGPGGKGGDAFVWGKGKGKGGKGGNGK